MWDWDTFARRLEAERRDEPTEPSRRSRWTLGEFGIALLVIAVLADTVLLASVTGSPR